MNLKLPKVKKGLHWTTSASEKILLTVIGFATCLAAAQFVFSMYEARNILLSDLFMLFIYVEIIGMVGAFYTTSRIPVTLPIIIAITALCRLIIMQSNNSPEFEGHINTCEDLEDFKTKYPLRKNLFAGELQTPAYTRFMQIGYK